MDHGIAAGKLIAEQPNSVAPEKIDEAHDGRTVLKELDKKFVEQLKDLLP